MTTAHSRRYRPRRSHPIFQIPGTEGAIRVILAFGGAELGIAKSPRDSNELVRMFGREAITALAELPTLQRRIPLAKPWLSAYFHTQGLSVAQTTRKLRVSDGSEPGYLQSAATNRERLRADAERIERSRRARRYEVGLASNQHRLADHSANPHYQSGTRPQGINIVMQKIKVKDAPLRLDNATAI